MLFDACSDCSACKKAAKECKRAAALLLEVEMYSCAPQGSFESLSFCRFPPFYISPIAQFHLRIKTPIKPVRTQSHNHWFHDIFQIFSFIVFLGQLLVGEGFELQISYWTHTFLCSIKRLLGNIERYNKSLWSLAKIHHHQQTLWNNFWRIILRITRNICSGNGKMFLGWRLWSWAFTWRWSTNSPIFCSNLWELKWNEPALSYYKFHNWSIFRGCQVEP